MEVYSIYYCFPYYILVLAYLFLAYYEYKYETGRSFAIILSNLIFIVFWGFRGFVGWDWVNYYLLYQEFEPTSVNDIYKDLFMEPGFSFFIFICKNLGFSYHIFILVNVLIDIFLLNKFLKRYASNYALGMVLYTVFCFALEIDTLRNIKSILLFMYSLRYVEERKLTKYFLLNLLGVCFHYSAILYLPIYFILNKCWSFKIVCFVVLLGNVLFIFQIHFLTSLFQFLGDIFNGKIAFALLTYSSEINNYGFSVGYFERMFTMVLILCFYHHFVKNETRRIFVNIYLLYFIAFFYLNEFWIIGSRVASLFVFAYIPIWLWLFALIHRRLNRVLYATFFYSYIFFKIYGLTNVVYYQYDNILFGMKSYGNRLEIFDSHFNELTR